jgi:hypothetical protein
MLSVNPGIFRIVCIEIFYTNQLEVYHKESQSKRQEKFLHHELLFIKVTCFT